MQHPVDPVVRRVEETAKSISTWPQRLPICCALFALGAWLLTFVVVKRSGTQRSWEGLFATRPALSHNSRGSVGLQLCGCFFATRLADPRGITPQGTVVGLRGSEAKGAPMQSNNPVPVQPPH